MHMIDPVMMLDAHRAEHRDLIDEAHARATSRRPRVAANVRRRMRASYIALLRRALVRARAAQARTSTAEPA